MKKSVLDKIFSILLVGSIIDAIFVGALAFILTLDFTQSLKAFIGAEIVFLLRAVGVRKIIKDRILSKLTQISEGMKEVSMGNLNYEIKVEKTGDELEELVESFERMRISLKAIMEKLEKGELI
ncbi:MAG: HAMP domain-containing protein [Sulfurihydrogenibium sp.]|jgi:methyl-accepting chemotaxis protein|nr:HAMP domain-containing protein [Sulfurihydrogenibium sp.]